MKNYYVQQWEEREKCFYDEYPSYFETATIGWTKDFFLTSYIKSLEDDVKKLKGMMKDTHPMEDGVPVETYGYEEEFNSCLDQQIGELEEGIIQLKTLI